MKSKKIAAENYLERKPMRATALEWTKTEDGLVTLNKKNTGFTNKLAQKLFRKPPVSYIHLDRHGSFIWLLLNGEKTVEELGDPVKQEFGEDAEPLYPRLIKYLAVLESYGFIEWAK